MRGASKHSVKEAVLRVLFCSSEIYPYSKSGGLADMASALPKALAKECEIANATPLYSFMSVDKLTKEPFSLNIKLNKSCYKAHIYSTKDRITTYFIKLPYLSETKNLYGYENDYLRFALFCKAIVELSKVLEVDLLHLNDWHTALAALFLKEQKLGKKAIFTIHNLAFQGVFDKSILDIIGIDRSYFTMDLIEFYGKVNYLKAGVLYSDKVTLVSPSYAKEVVTKEFGCGLEGFLKSHEDKIVGILNGIDYEEYNPKSDNFISYNYDKDNLELKYKNKVKLLEKLKLKDENKPLIVQISRLTSQKGFDLIIDSLDKMLKLPINYALLVEGDEEYKKRLLEAAKEHKNISINFGYSEEFSRMLYASGDFLLMPSLFEPCGLNQMIAFRYGAIPIVTSVGGLKDSVFEEDRCGRGIVIKESKKESFLEAISRAVEIYEDKKKKESIMSKNLECDFSIQRCAKSYYKVYKKVVFEVSG